MLIPRDTYLNRLIDRMNNGMIKVITGIRRCGKSFLLFDLFYAYLLRTGIPAEQIIRIALDDDDQKELRDPDKLNTFIKNSIKNNDDPYYIFIDEAQYAISREELKNKDKPIRLYGILNGLLRRKNVDMYITGSNSKFLSTDVATEFRGRGDEIHIAPLSFSEYAPVFPGNQFEAFNQYMLYGGMPHILSEKSEEDRVRYLKHLHDEIYLKDIIERYDIKNISGMEDVMKITASSIGSLTNAKKISDTFTSKGLKDLSIPSINNYLRYLRESFILEKAERYDIKGRKYINAQAKYYYADTGLRNALLNFRQFEETHLMGNIIYNELIYRGFNVDVGIVEISAIQESKQVRKQLEVDFTANLGNRRYYIQSAYAIPDLQKMEQEQASLIRIPDSFKKIIVVNNYSPLWRNEAGITIMNIYDFLLKPNSLDL